MKRKFSKVIGTGGIGFGMFFLTDDNRTLGRSESRLVTLSDAKDYCKLHIVFHYISTLLVPEVEVFPIGCVGADSVGERMIGEMRRAGMDTTYVSKVSEYPTAVSVCLQYPDKEGCNFTASNGAGCAVTPDYITTCLRRIGPGPETIVAAIPEVSMESRLELLRFGRKKGSFCVLSVAAGEAGQLKELDMLWYCDLLAVNLEEAQAISGANGNTQETARGLYEYAKQFNPEIRVLVTCGKDGAYAFDSSGMEFISAIPAAVVNTTGAGDAFLGGTIAALALGYPFLKGHSDLRFGETALASAPELGALCAGMAVESPDSIAMQVTPEALKKRIEAEGWNTKCWFAGYDSGEGR